VADDRRCDFADREPNMAVLWGLEFKVAGLARTGLSAKPCDVAGVE